MAGELCKMSVWVVASLLAGTRMKRFNYYGGGGGCKESNVGAQG